MVKVQMQGLPIPAPVLDMVVVRRGMDGYGSILPEIKTTLRKIVNFTAVSSIAILEHLFMFILFLAVCSIVWQAQICIGFPLCAAVRRLCELLLPLW